MRSTIRTNPSSSLTPMSPVRNQPSTTASAVAAGSSRYPAKTLWPRTTTSPRSPVGRSTTASGTAASAISTSTPQMGCPMVPGRVPNTFWLKVADGEVSDRP